MKASMRPRIFRTIKIDPFERTVKELKFENKNKSENFKTLEHFSGGQCEAIPYFVGKKRVLIFLNRVDHFDLSLKKFRYKNILLRGISFALSPKVRTGNIQSLPYSVSRLDIEYFIKWDIE